MQERPAEHAERSSRTQKPCQSLLDCLKSLPLQAPTLCLEMEPKAGGVSQIYKPQTSPHLLYGVLRCYTGFDGSWLRYAGVPFDVDPLSSLRELEFMCGSSKTCRNSLRENSDSFIPFRRERLEPYKPTFRDKSFTPQLGVARSSEYRRLKCQRHLLCSPCYS